MIVSSKPEVKHRNEHTTIPLKIPDQQLETRTNGFLLGTSYVDNIKRALFTTNSDSSFHTCFFVSNALNTLLELKYSPIHNLEVRVSVGCNGDLPIDDGNKQQSMIYPYTTTIYMQSLLL